MTKVFIANFGRGNYAWERCRAAPSIATMNDEDVQHFWESGDKDSFIERCLQTRKTARGNPVPKQLASRWFNLMTIICDSEYDIWIHREDDKIWWTVSDNSPAEIDATPRSVPYQDMKVFECHKQTIAWSDKNKQGTPLRWKSLHPKAKDFLSTESTLQSLGPKNSKYAIALIEGDDLEPWHSQPKWQEVLDGAKSQPGSVFSPRKKSIAQMAYQAEVTTQNSNGQETNRTVKNKDFLFRDKYELEGLIADLLEAQDDRCAISGLRLQFLGSHDDEWMLCSLDRIDSDGHYESCNLQVVCRFVNRWKSDIDDGEFRRLLSKLRNKE